MVIRPLPRLAVSTSLPGRDLAAGPEAPTPEAPAPAPSAWAVASEARCETARRRLAAVTRSEALHAAGAPWAEADRAAGALWELDSTPADLLCADPLTGVLRRHAVVGTLEVWSRRGMVLIVPVSRGVAITALPRDLGRAARGEDRPGTGLCRAACDAGARRPRDRARALPAVSPRGQAPHRALPRHADARPVRPPAGLHRA